MNKGFLFFLVVGIIGGLIVIGMALMIFGDNVKNLESGKHELFIPSNYSYDSVRNLLANEGVLRNDRTFDWVAGRMNYHKTVEPGKYLVDNHLSNRALIRLLRHGYGEESVTLTLHTINSRQDLYRKAGAVLECDSLSLQSVFEDESRLAAAGLTLETGWGIVLCDTYQFHWDTPPEAFFTRMRSEYDKYWTDERRSKAAAHDLSPMECIILASIIEKESVKLDEYRRIAGVYINRLQKNWPLQADPTIKFALGQRDLQRILNTHLEIDSPYNTYKNTGLPPGPIGLPEKTAIEAVLDAEDHNFMYFCARDDFSGYHEFSRTLQEHNRNARKYQDALNKNGIY